jgi:hypothetical protein
MKPSAELDPPTSLEKIMDTTIHDENHGSNGGGENQDPEIVSGYVRRVIGHEVTIRQGITSSIEADSAVIRQGGVGILKSDQTELTSSACAYTQADQAELKSSRAAVIVTRNQANLDQSAARVLVSAGDVRLNQSAALAVISKDVTLQENNGVVFLIAQSVHGDTHPLFGTKEAAVFGAVAGLVGSFVILLSRLVRRKS